MDNLQTKTQKIMDAALKALETAKVECAIMESLPIVPNFVHVYPLYGSMGSARYNATSKAHALKIFKAFNIAPSFICRDNNTVSVRAIDDGKATEVSECLAIVEIEKYSQKIRFYVQTAPGIVRIEIDMGFNPFGSFRVDNPKKVKYYSWVFCPTNKLGALHRVVSYAPVSRTGDMSGGHYLYAVYEHFEIVDQLGE